MLVVDARHRASTLVVSIHLIRVLFTLDDATLRVVLVCIFNLVQICSWPEIAVSLDTFVALLLVFFHF